MATSSVQSFDFSEDYQRELDETVYSLFEITPTEQEQIRLRIQ